MDVTPLGSVIGARVEGIDFDAPLADATLAGLSKALLEHQVLVMRAPDLAPGQHLTIADQFGDTEVHAFFPNLGEGFERVSVLDSEQGNVASMWHSDETFLPEPPLGTLLSARIIPAVGGDTCWASTTASYEALSPNMKRYLDGAMALHDLSRTSELAYNTGNGTAESYANALLSTRRFEHPVVRTHPETGRRALYVNVAHTARFAGWTEAESAPLLDYLFRHQVSPEFTCRFSWQPGSIAIWDNRCVQHNPVNDYHGHRRVMHRITLAGDRPR